MKLLNILILIYLPINLVYSQSYKLKTVWGEGSDSWFELYDNHGTKVETNEYIKRALIEKSSLMSLKNEYLFFLNDENIYCSYNLETETKKTLTYIGEIKDNTSPAIWSPDGKKMAFIIGLQEKHTMMYILSFNDQMELAYVEILDCNDINYECGSGCSSTPNKDYQFDNKNLIKYKYHWNLELPTDFKFYSLDKKSSLGRLKQRIQKIQKQYYSIQEVNESKYKKDTINLTDESEGGEIIKYKNGNKVKKIKTTYYSSTGKIVYHYYLSEGIVNFIYEEKHTYNAPFYVNESDPEYEIEAFDENKTKIEEHRYYFFNNQLIKYIDNNQKNINVNAPLFLKKMIWGAKAIQKIATQTSLEEK